MTATVRCTVLALTAASALAPTLLLTSAPASAATKLHCSASASPSNPKQYSTVHLNVNGDKSGAHIRAVVYYKTTDHTKYATANRYGNASIPYYISDATKGFRVKVGITLTSGKARAGCATAFTPR